MGKKSTKRKTQWRTLSITECPQQHSKNGSTKKFTINNNNTTENNIVESISVDDDEYTNRYSSTNPLYLKRKSSTLSSAPNNGNDYRNSSSHNNHSYYSKYNSTSSTSSVFSSKFTSRRRPYSLQNGTSKYYCSYGAERATSRGPRTTSETRDKNNLTKPLFNEDDYTRITTPRQDVIFKKGYFSQPRKYVSSTDTNTTSSAAASIASVDETMSATSVPSLSPEQCPSQADSLDPEQGFIYSFIDQNGVVYSYVPNALDQYNGQMMMLPYGYPPYNMCSPDINSPTCSTEDFDQNRTSVVSNKISDDLKQKNVECEERVDCPNEKDSTMIKENPESTDITTNEDNEESTVVNESEDTDICDASKDTVENLEISQHVAGQFINYGYHQPCYPHLIYPYLFPQQFMPVFGNDYDASNEMCDEDLESQNRVRYRCRKRDNTDGNSTGVSATTTDYSEDELSDSEDTKEINENIPINIKQREVEAENGSTQFTETEPKKITLNTDVKEFVPRVAIKASLNVNVKEFLPRDYKNQKQHDQTVERDSTLQFAEQKRKESISRKELKMEQPSISKMPTDCLTLAEKIKQKLGEERAVAQKKFVCQKATPQKAPTEKIGLHKKEVEPDCLGSTKNKNKKIDQSRAIRFQPSYAQIANKNKSANEKAIKRIVTKTKKPQDFNVDGIVEVPPQVKVAVEAPVLVQFGAPVPVEPPIQIVGSAQVANPVQAPAVNSSGPTVVDTWRTVKPRGKRSKHFKGLVMEEEQIEEPHLQLVETLLTRPSVEFVDSAEINESSTECKEPAETISITSSSSEKKNPPKSRSRKTPKKSPVPNKKTKKLELVEPNSELYKKTEIMSGDNTKEHLLNNKPTRKYMVEMQQDDIDKELKDEHDVLSSPKHSSPGQSEPDLTFDRLYLGKGFGRSPMDIMKRFDFKYNNKSILREEEEMVLNVIKSLNNSGFEKKPETMVDENNDVKTLIEACNRGNYGKNNGSETDTVSNLSTEYIATVKNEDEVNEPLTIEAELVTCNETVPRVNEEVIGDGNISNLEIEELKSSVTNLDEDTESRGCAELVETTCNLVDSNSDQREQEEPTDKKEEDRENEDKEFCNGDNKDFCEELTIANELQDVSNDQNDFRSQGEDVSQELITNEVCNNFAQEQINEVRTTKFLNGFDESTYKEINNQIMPSLLLKNTFTEERIQSVLPENDLNTTINHKQLTNGFKNISSECYDKKQTARNKVDLKEELVGATIDLRPEDLFDIAKSSSEFSSQILLGQFDLTVSSAQLTNELDSGSIEKDINQTVLLYSEYSSDAKELVAKTIEETSTNLPNSCFKNNENSTPIRAKFPANSENESLDHIACVEVLNNLIKIGTTPEGQVNTPEVAAISQGWKLIMGNGGQVNSNRIAKFGVETSVNGQIEIEECQRRCDTNKNIFDNFEPLESFEKYEQRELTFNENINLKNCAANEADSILIAEVNDSLTNRYVIFNGNDTANETSLSKEIYISVEDPNRTLNAASTSCHRSSGIKSDCDDSDPSSAFDLKDSKIELLTRNEVTDKKSTVFHDSTGSDCNSSSKLLITVHETEQKTKCSAENKHPTNHQLETNSACGDTQAVSFTSNKTSSSTDLSSNEAKGGTNPIGDNSKFQNPSELGSDDARFPLTEAVKQWLSQETKDLTPEPILRVPTDPNLKSLLQKQIRSVENENDWSTTDESDDENDSNLSSNTNPKNLKSNPLHVSSVNIVNDNDSDYNSDNNQRYDDKDDKTCERVAKILTDNKSIIQEKCDLLDYWDDEFIRNPQKWLLKSSISSRSTSMSHKSTSSATTSSGQCEPYESLYGTTINYNQLLASNSEFLSSNILSFNNGNAINNYTRTSYHKNDTSLNTNNNNFDNDINRITTTTPTMNNTPTKSNDNCLMPPDVCCILM